MEIVLGLVVLVIAGYFVFFRNPHAEKTTTTTPIDVVPQVTPVSTIVEVKPETTAKKASKPKAAAKPKAAPKAKAATTAKPKKPRAKKTAP